MIKLWVDFNNASKNGVRLNCKGTIEDIDRQKVVLKEGLRLIIWDNDEDDSGCPNKVIVDAIAHYDYKQNVWEAVFNPDEIKHEPI